jgi:hypothetical protein
MEQLDKRCHPKYKLQKSMESTETETVGHLTNDNHERYTREENETALENANATQLKEQ